MKNYKESLMFLESEQIIRQRMSEVNEEYIKHDLPVVKSNEDVHTTLVMGGEIVLSRTKKGHKIEIRSFPYETVILKKSNDSLKWSIKSGNNPSLKNAYRILDILFMQQEILENYIYRIKSKHNL